MVSVETPPKSSDQPTKLREDRHKAERRRRRWLGTAHRGGYGVLGVVIVISVWYAATLTGLVQETLLPRPDQIISTAVVLLSEQDLLFDIRVSITRVLLGVLIGTAVALPIGFFLAWYGRLRAMFEPLVNFFRALPPIALIPLVIIYFGIGETARISILVYAAFFSAVVVLYEGIATIDPLLVRAARVLGASPREIFFKVVAPASIPHLFTALRVALGVSWATVVAAELIAAQRGLGSVIQDAGHFFNIPVIYTGIVMIGISAFIMDFVLKLAQTYTTRWQEKAQ